MSRSLTNHWLEASRQTALLVGIASLFALVTNAFDLKWKTPAEFHGIKSSQARPVADTIVWVDVRTKEQFEANHIPNAVHFDEDNSESSLETVRNAWNPRKKTVVYGEGAGSDRAQRVARLLRVRLPSKQVLLLEGGWAAWPRTQSGQASE